MITLYIQPTKGGMYWRNTENYVENWHNNNGPAIIHLNATNHWFVNGSRHRLNGPAIEWYDGVNEWYINGIKYETELEYWLAVQNYDIT